MTAPHVTPLTKVGWGSAIARVTDFGFTIPQIEVLDNLDQLPMGNRDKPRAGVIYSKMKFSTQIGGSGVAGPPLTEPFDQLLWKACAMAESAVGGGGSETSWIYTVDHTLLGAGNTPVDLISSIGNLYKDFCSNAIGDFEIILMPGEPAKINWDFDGTFTAPSETAISDSLGTTATPVVCAGLTITIGGVALKLRKVSIKSNNNKLSPRKTLSGTNAADSPLLTNAAPTFEIEAEQSAIATYNPVTRMTAETKTTLAAVLGSTLGNTCTIGMDAFPDMGPDFNDSDELLGFAQKYRQSYDSGDTMLNIAYT